jgi:hypothetical protein
LQQIQLLASDARHLASQEFTRPLENKPKAA